MEEELAVPRLPPRLPPRPPPRPATLQQVASESEGEDTEGEIAGEGEADDYEDDGESDQGEQGGGEAIQESWAHTEGRMLRFGPRKTSEFSVASSSSTSDEASASDGSSSRSFGRLKNKLSDEQGSHGSQSPLVLPGARMLRFGPRKSSLSYASDSMGEGTVCEDAEYDPESLIQPPRPLLRFGPRKTSEFSLEGNAFCSARDLTQNVPNGDSYEDSQFGETENRSPLSGTPRSGRRPSWISAGSALSNRRRGSTFSSVSSAGAREQAVKDSEQANEEAIAAIAQVAQRRTFRQESKSGLMERLKSALLSGDPLILVYNLLCEVADAVLVKFHSVLDQSPTWNKITSGGYIPGSASERGSPESNPFLDLFVQIVCGWPDASVAFGPVQVKASSLLARELGMRSDLPVMGTLRIVNTPHTLPDGPVTDKIVLLAKAALELGDPHVETVPDPVSSIMVRSAANPMFLFRFKASIQAAIGLVERIQPGDGGTAKKPTEFQMLFVQRVNESVMQCLDHFTSATRSLRPTPVISVH